MPTSGAASRENAVFLGTGSFCVALHGDASKRAETGIFRPAERVAAHGLFFVFGTGEGPGPRGLSRAGAGLRGGAPFDYSRKV